MKGKTKYYKRGYTFSDGTEIYFDKGNFDEWCVYLKKGNGIKIPKDEDYFNEIYALGEQYGFEKVYHSFEKVYGAVQKNKWGIYDRQKCEKICKMVDDEYEEDTLKLWFTFYMTMLAEENKTNSILGKTIKNLAVYKILICQKRIKPVTREMVGKRHYELQQEMNDYGLKRIDY